MLSLKKRRTLKILFSAIASIAVSITATSYASADDLALLYRAAVHNDPRYRGAEATYNAVQERVPQARAGLLPRAQAKAARNRHDEEVTTDSTIASRPTGTAEYRSSEYSLSVTQPIVNVAAWAVLRQANAEVRRAEAEYLAAKQDLIVRLAEAYFQLLLSQETHALASAERQTLAQHLEAAQAKQRAGVSSIAEAEDARARFQISVTQEVEASDRIDDHRQALREIVGQEPENLAGLSEPLPSLTPDPPEIERWVEMALTQNASVNAASEAANAAREEIARARGDHYPTLDLVGAANRTDADGSIAGPGIRSDNNVVGLELKLPLYSGGSVSARAREASYRYDAALQELEAQRRNAERTARSAFKDIRSAQTKAEALRQAVIAGEIALEVKTQGYRVGVHRTSDVLDATRDLFRSKRDYSEARYGYVFATLRLKQAAGTLTDDDVEQLNKWLH